MFVWLVYRLTEVLIEKEKRLPGECRVDAQTKLKVSPCPARSAHAFGTGGPSPSDHARLRVVSAVELRVWRRLRLATARQKITGACWNV